MAGIWGGETDKMSENQQHLKKEWVREAQKVWAMRTKVSVTSVPTRVARPTPLPAAGDHLVIQYGEY